VLVSSLIAVYLQSLCIKLGTITGMDLAQMCRAHLPRWLNIFLYLMAEGAVRTKTIHAMDRG
jgi:metal iron transporter